MHADQQRRGRVLVICPASLETRVVSRESVDRRPLQSSTVPVWKVRLVTVTNFAANISLDSIERPSDLGYLKSYRFDAKIKFKAQI